MPQIYYKIRTYALCLAGLIFAAGSINAAWDIHVDGKEEIVEHARQEAETREETRDRHDKERFDDGRMQGEERESYGYSHQANYQNEQ